MTDAPVAKKPAPLWQRVLPWLITLGCFAYLYSRIAARTPADQTVVSYLGAVFADVNWLTWLALMIPYSLLYLFIDTAVLWRVVNWFNARVDYSRLLPVRASAYIISILNEQVGKGAMALYLNRRDGVPAWQVGSSMLFIMFCEFFYLLAWATVGVFLAWDILPPLFHWIPWIALGAFAFLLAWVAFFRGSGTFASGLKNAQLMKAFREASLGNYISIMVLRSPALLAAVWVYQQAAALFGVPIPLTDMLGFLPVIFFSTLIPGPFRAVAVTLWPTLFPDYTAQMAVFGFVQHNFFLLFNAGIGLIFLQRANSELFDQSRGTAEPR